MFIYDDYKAFLNIYNGYIINEYNVCFLSDPYCHLYNKRNYNSVSNNIPEEKEMNDLKLYQNYDISNLDVRNIKIKVNKELPLEYLIAVTKFERLITNQYKQYCNKVNYSKIPVNNNFYDINNIMFLDDGSSWNYNTINEKSLRGTENAIYQLSMHLSRLKFNNIIVLTKDGIQKQLNNKLYYDNIQNFKNYNANIIIHQSIPSINNLSDYSDKKHIIYIHHDVTVSCIKNTYSKIYLFDKYIYKYIFVSNWQKHRYIRYYGLNNEKCVVIQNAINPIINLKLSSIKKTKSLIYVSSPYMGVINVLPLFNTLLKYIPDLKLKIFSSFDIENTIDNNFNPLNMDFLDNLELDSKDKYYLNYYKEFIKHDNIEYYGSVPQHILFKHFNDSMILFYPCVLPGTCCTSILEAMAYRCFVVSSDLGAFQETSNNMAYLFDSCLDVNHINYSVKNAFLEPIGIDQFSKNYVKMFLEKTIDLVNNYYEPDKQQHLNKQQDFINNNCKWDNKVEQFMEFIK